MFSVWHMFECENRNKVIADDIIRMARTFLQTVLKVFGLEVGVGKNRCIAVALGWTPSVTWKMQNGREVVKEVIQYDRMPKPFWNEAEELYRRLIYFAGTHKTA